MLVPLVSSGQAVNLVGCYMTDRNGLEFERFEPLLWRTLAWLARSGYVIPPTDARDVIHDFFAEAWAGLTERYDDKRGSRPSYISVAFYRFARRRVLQQYNLRSRLTNSGCLRDRPAERPSPGEAAEQKEEADVFRDALTQLPTNERTVLVDILNQCGTEREIAAKRGITRHRLRETLVDALGRLSTLVGRRLPAESADRAVVLALWRDGRNVRDTAAVLRLTVPAVRAVRQRHVAGLLKAIRGEHTSPFKGTAMTNEPLELLKKALLTPEDSESRRAVADNAERIREALEVHDVTFSEAETKKLEEHAEWTAAIFEALASASETSDEETAIAESMQQIRNEEDTEIAEAFVAALSALPAPFANWDFWFEKVETAPEDYQRYLSEHAIIRAAEGRADGLVVYGLTPSTFLEASRGIELLTDRLIRTASWAPESVSNHSEELKHVYKMLRGQRERGEPISVDLVGREFSMNERDTPTIPYSLLLAEVQGTPQLSTGAAEPLLWWLLDAAQFIPRLILGYEAETLGEREVRLKQCRNTQERSLVALWGKRGNPDNQVDEKSGIQGIGEQLPTLRLTGLDVTPIEGVFKLPSHRASRD